jgi:hypothetical protein
MKYAFEKLEMHWAENPKRCHLGDLVIDERIFFILIVYGLFNDIASSSDYMPTASDD